jgi:NO-binding membrane sensor protein with MHYT domain
MEETAYVWGTLSTVGGLLVAVGLSGLALWLVKRARDGNRRVREARRDPHVDRGKRSDRTKLAQKDHRDIGQ